MGAEALIDATLAGIDDVRAWWADENTGMDDRRALLARMVARIVIKPVGRGGNRFDEDRVEIHWKA